MKAHKITLLVIDFDELGAGEINTVLENQRFPNDCINLQIMKVKTVDIGEWDDSHPLNHHEKMEGEFNRIFAERTE